VTLGALLLAIGGAFLITALVSGASSEYTITWWTVDGGGGFSQGGITPSRAPSASRTQAPRKVAITAWQAAFGLGLLIRSGSSSTTCPWSCDNHELYQIISVRRQ